MSETYQEEWGDWTALGPFAPTGRSVAIEAASGYCDPFEPCDPEQAGQALRRHLWSVHDDTRSITDPDGWAEHVRSCQECPA